MLQKLIMVFFSLVTMVASAVLPGDWGAEPPASDPARVVDERVATLGYVPGAEFAAVSVVWVEMDGVRIQEDAWGEGRIEELRFKVGIKRAEGNALRLGERTVPLTPTDVFTIRGFEGRYAFSDVGASTATLALTGTVKNTLVSNGKGGDLATQGASLATGRGAPAGGGKDRLAYVVLETGDPVGTLEVAQGAARKLFTSGASASRQEPGATALDVRWVKIDDQLVTRYAYGEGELHRVSFVPDERFRSRLNFSGLDLGFDGGDRVEVREFLGTWSVTMRPGGGARLKLDGWASSAEVVPGGTTANSDPDLAFTFEPLAPSTRDLVTFRADARDTDGTVIVHEWTFLRKASDVAAYGPEDLLTATANGAVVEHRFTRPGTWEVTLRVVDDQGGVATVVQDLEVANTAPVAAFDWFPDSPVSLDSTRFYDRSSDLDGGIAARRWDFGDGTTSEAKEPTHAYAKNGVYNVTLAVTDVNGATATTRQLLVVRNAAPDCAFALDPPEPRAFQLVRLLDASTDREGPLATWRWQVRNLADASAPVVNYTDTTPVHTFEKATRHEVSLTVTDAEGAATTCASTVLVANSPPIASFTNWPEKPATGEFTFLNATASDKDGRIVRYEWRIEGDPDVKEGASIGYSFPYAGAFRVSLTVFDNGGLQNATAYDLVVRNGAPVAAFQWSPFTPYTDQNVTFTDTSADPDGDDIDSWTWDFGEAQTPRYRSGPQVVHAFEANGVHNVTLTVKDVHGNSRSVEQSVIVLNRAPTGAISFEPNPAVAQTDITFTTDATDPDGTVERFEWLFGDGTRLEGRTVVHNFTEAGTYPVKLVLTDDDGGQSELVVQNGLLVHEPGPSADFVTSAPVGATGRWVTFTDASAPRGPAIAEWAWRFGDGGTASLSQVAHKYARAGTYSVTLTVEDASGASGTVTKPFLVTDPPIARMSVSSFVVDAGQSVTFRDLSEDPDGVVAGREWIVDGALVSSDLEFSHVFSGPGDHPVRLTVTDDRGVATSTWKNVTVRNQAPVAGFDVLGTPLHGQTVSFRSTSTDADGSLVESKTRWFLQDRQVASGSFSFDVRLEAGVHRVAIRVEDELGATAGVVKNVEVLADVPIRYEFPVRYEDGSLAPLTQFVPEFKSLQTNRVYRVGSGVTLDTENSVIVLDLPAGEWRPDYQYQYVGKAPKAPQTFMADDIDLVVGVRVPEIVVLQRDFAAPTLLVEDGVEEGAYGHLPGLLDLTRVLPWEGAYYASPHERIRGEVGAYWLAPAAPADGATIEVYATRVVAPQASKLAEERLGGRLTPVEADPPIVSTRVAGLAGADGTYAFELPFVTERTGAGVALNPPGWYAIDVVVRWPNPVEGHAIEPVRARSYVFVDADGALGALVFGALP